MPTSAAFRLSIYLTMAIPCAALGFAEYELLPEVMLISAGVLVSLGVLYHLETRVELLSIPAANRLGLIVGLANFVWMAFRVLREINEPQLVNTNWPLLGLAMLGPLAMTLMPAKLARREKHAGDYWWLHGLALSTAALAGAMAEDLLTFILIGLYSVCAVWSIRLFYLGRAGRLVAPVPGHPAGVPFVGVVGDARPRRGIARALLFAGAAAAITIPLYLLTPRSSFARLEFGKPRVEIGYAADQMVDLRNTGNLRANQQVAFTVSAHIGDEPKTDLSLEQRWRGRVLRRYQNGVWSNGELRLPAVEPSPRTVGEWTLPRLGPGQFTLTFEPQPGARGRFLADPVAWVPDEPPPVATILPSGYRPWIWGGDGSFLSDGRTSNRDEPIRYVQAWRASRDADLSPPFRILDPDPESVLRPLRENPVPKVKEYADALVERMIREGKLPAEPWDRVTYFPRREFHDQIAQAFTAYLATSPEFTYTTELRRERRDLDPIEEFLFHSRAGHCERFATALALMLRSQGIPSVMVLGFKGCEPTEEPGHYVVRQEHAHAWVEAFIEQYGPAPPRGIRPISRWRSLDPTPGGAPVTAAQTGGWAGQARTWLQGVYNQYVADYNAAQRRRALGNFVAWVTRADVLATTAALIATAVLARYLIRRRRSTTPSPAHVARWLGPLYDLLAAHGFTSAPGETPREFTTRVGMTLRQKSATEPVAEVPLDWAEAYYETRFGARTLAPDRLAALDTRLDELRQALSAT